MGNDVAFASNYVSAFMSFSKINKKIDHFNDFFCIKKEIQLKINVIVRTPDLNFFL